MKKVLFVVMASLLFTGCKTRYVTLTDVVRDTVCQVRTDTFTRFVVRATVDTLRLHDSIIVYRAVDGTTERVEVYHVSDRIRIQHDTVDLYRAKYDSLAAVHAQRQDVPVPVVQRAPWWQRQLKYLLIAIALLAISIIVIRYVRRSRDGI